MTRPRWNANLHYDRLLAAGVPADARSVLDVGCGDGFLAVRLAKRVPEVTAVDIDGPVLQRARARFPGAPVRWVNEDFLAAEPETYDAVVSNAMLHHLPDTALALRRLASSVAPGGTLGVVTLVRYAPRNTLWQLASWVAIGIAIRVRGKWEHTAPLRWPPRDTLRQVRAHARAVLPGVRVRRLLYGRVLISWQAPPRSAA
ncbi:class I SAM-dependent methyltransferase [Amycolatopsis sp.]|uniref:class I SAM-dependent methyltransferase n=1 Tax=Amycolatopsis sp. TaxID=37632 RepID=UPI002D070065|nr:class I SAM-dependent methyltransferase [Amycolatopsis sp.]HVV14559.1 class I SAM-dependent methyltransferase [Amycolatopsis sp.]